MWTYLNDMEGVEGMHPTETPSAQVLNANTVETTIMTGLTAELAAAVLSKDSPALQTNEGVEEKLSFLHPEQQRVVLATISFQASRVLEDRKNNAHE
jgi:hypothetical protein